jgi:RimJ/RimL family protein N-acetyltransferase
MGNRIRSERLCLRQLEAEEARALLRGKGDPERPWMAGYPMQGTLIAVEAFVRALDNGADPGMYGVYQLVRSSDTVVVGDIGFHGPPSPRGSVTVGYGLAPGARGQGYATEALRAVVWALAQPEVVAVEADTTHANLPSQRVMERAGMRLYDKSDQLRFYRVP